MTDDRKGSDTTQIGEGDYAAARRFQRDQSRFARKGPVERMARKAADDLNGVGTGEKGLGAGKRPSRKRRD
ncbi:MAG: hypothetical protein H6923_11125 [Alphaproteobacteria bacterium]|nr:hypothetical protein [Alphaproteobacteria bacterium]